MAKRALLFSLVVLAASAATAVAEERPALPLKVSANHRYLVDQNDRPFLIHGDTAWSLITAVDKNGAELYLENRRKKGFNAIIVNLIEHHFNGPVNREGHGPFTKPGDFSTPDEKYWLHADWVLKRAAEKGIVVFLFPMYLGYKGSNEGWYQEVLLNGEWKCREYGRFLGKRYGNYTNIVWTMGGDRNPELAREGHYAIVAGIKEQMPGHLFSAHAHPDEQTAEQYGLKWLDILGTYSYEIVHRKLLRDYNYRPVMPFVLMESTYEGEHNSSPLQIRRQAYWTILCGAAGQFLGVRPIWSMDKGWEEALDGPGSRDMVRLHALMMSRPWWRLVPDQQHAILVEGLGEHRGLDYATAAATEDGRLFMAYTPAVRTLVVDTAQLRPERLRAWWFNPRDGQSTPAGERTRRKREPFNPPGEGDWVLVLEDASDSSPAQ